MIDHVYTECKKHDILLLLETVAFPFGGEKKTDASFLNRKAATVIESARQLSRFCDIYKAEFPGTMGHESDNQLRDNLTALNAASERPWVLLSAGVDYPDYFKQVQMAMGVGRLGRPGRSSVLEGVLPPGRSRSPQSVRRDDGLQTSGRRRHGRPRARNSLVRPLRLDQGRPGVDPGHRGLARPLWLSSGLGPANDRPQRGHRARFTDQALASQLT